jgi:hypothetical protein
VSPFSIAHPKPPVRFPPTTAVADGKHVAGHVANGAVMGPPVVARFSDVRSTAEVVALLGQARNEPAV